MQFSWRLLADTENVGMKSRKNFQVGQTINVPNGTKMLWTLPFVRMRCICGSRFGADKEPFSGRDPWTKEEDEQLWEAFQRLGNKWHGISCTLNGRPGSWMFPLLVAIRRLDLNYFFSLAVHCRNRLQSLQRLRAAEQAASNNMELEATSENRVDPSLLNVSQ